MLKLRNKSDGTTYEALRNTDENYHEIREMLGSAYVGSIVTYGKLTIRFTSQFDGRESIFRLSPMAYLIKLGPKDFTCSFDIDTKYEVISDKTNNRRL